MQGLLGWTGAFLTSQQQQVVWNGYLSVVAWFPGHRGTRVCQYGLEWSLESHKGPLLLPCSLMTPLIHDLTNQAIYRGLYHFLNWWYYPKLFVSNKKYTLDPYCSELRPRAKASTWFLLLTSFVSEVLLFTCRRQHLHTSGLYLYPSYNRKYRILNLDKFDCMFTYRVQILPWVLMHSSRCNYLHNNDARTCELCNVLGSPWVSISTIRSFFTMAEQSLISTACA